jgi:mitochondrial fission protein ELM1
MTGADTPAPVWVLEDPRAGTAAQALGIAERLGLPFRRVPLSWGPLARLPWPMPSLAGLADRGTFAPPWPRLAISAGRRAAPVSRWLRARGVSTVHAMRPGLGAGDFDLLVIGAHDRPRPAPNLIEILGAAHRVTPEALAAAPRLDDGGIGLLLGGPVRGEGMDPAEAARIARLAAGLGGFVHATTSRRTGSAAADAVERALSGVPHRLHRFGTGGPNPYLSILASARALVVTADSISMISEALATGAALFLAETSAIGPRHQALAERLYAEGLAAPLGAAGPPPRAPRDETARVAAEILRRGLV